MLTGCRHSLASGLTRGGLDRNWRHTLNPPIERRGVQLLELLRPKTALPVHHDDYTVFKSPAQRVPRSVDHAPISTTRRDPRARRYPYRFDLPGDHTTPDRRFAKAFNTFVEHDGAEWAVCALINGRRKKS